MPASIVWNRKPLPQNRFAPLPPTAMRPAGKLLDQIAAEEPVDIHGRLLKACMLHDVQAMDVAQAELVARMRSDAPPTGTEIRALLDYHAVSADKGVPLFLLRYAKSLRDFLAGGGELTPSQAANTGDLLHMALWLYNLTGQRVLLEFCRLIKAQSSDWMSTLHIFQQTKAVKDEPDRQLAAYWRVHGPTVAASLKIPSLQALFEGGLKNETAFAVGWEKLSRYHGAAHGLFSADPLLAGANPSRGVDPAVVTEMINTLRTVLWTQGLPLAGDLLESTLHGPLCVANGTQAANQIHAGKGPAAQGFAEAAACAWMASHDGGLAAILYGGGEVRWRIGGQLVRIQTQTDYPFDGTVTLRVHTREPAAFPLWLRIPEWAEGASIAVGDEEPTPREAGGFAQVTRTWQDGDTLRLVMPMPVRTANGYHQTQRVLRGPLTYALPVEDAGGWNMALLEDAAFECGVQAGIPVVTADAAVVSGWTASGDVPAAPPVAPAVTREETCRITLLPYGLTRARIAQFPVGKIQAQ